MRIFWFLCVACFVIALICLGWPCNILTLHWTFWAIAGFFMWLLDGHYGEILVPARQTKTVQE